MERSYKALTPGMDLRASCATCSPSRWPGTTTPGQTLRRGGEAAVTGITISLKGHALRISISTSTR
jgi:hypothetical protein